MAGKGGGAKNQNVAVVCVVICELSAPVNDF
jgi:hypothetical protein